jgi:hypothetical protein
MGHGDILANRAVLLKTRRPGDAGAATLSDLGKL